MNLISYLDFQLTLKEPSEVNRILTIVENMAEELEEDYESYLMKDMTFEEEDYIVDFLFGYEELESITVTRRGENR